MSNNTISKLINLDSGLITTAFSKVGCNQPIYLTFIVKRINTEHCNVHMRILHSCILPVNQSDFFLTIFLHKQEIIWHRINMCQNFSFCVRTEQGF